MDVLLDTCSFLWIGWDSPRLSALARSLYAAEANRVFLSAVSAWEIQVKSRLGRLPLPLPAHEFVALSRERHGISPLPLEEEAVGELRKLPPLHADPFDRMLICQALHHGMAILTPDPLIHQYPVTVRW